MAPKKGQKMSLNAFLEDSTLGSWADEMESLPTAPAPRTDEERARGNDFGRRDRDFLSSRPDRAGLPPRDDVPLPTQPPYTAFVGNLAFDLIESELEAFFAPHQTKSVKIIKDRDEKPKGFGYVEFVDVEGLKDALSKSGASFSNRTIRVSVAEPPKERSGGFGSFDDDKFAGNWRRDGPLPDRPETRDGSRRKYEGLSSEATAGVSEATSDWRSNRPARVPSEPEPPANRRRGSGLSTPDGQPGAADLEETWTIGSKFKPTASAPDAPTGSRFGSLRGRGDMGPPQAPDEGDWRRPRAGGRTSTSPTNSTPPTPQMGRRKLDLLPRSSNPSANPSPIASPKSATNTTFSVSSRSNPFGAARPVDVTARENAVAEKIEKERDEVKERVTHSMSRQSSRQARERPLLAQADGAKTPPNAAASSAPPTPSSPRISAVSTVRPAFSFASAASAKKDAVPEPKSEENNVNGEKAVDDVAEQMKEVSV